MTGKKDLLSALMDMLCIWLVGEDELCGAPRLNHRTTGLLVETIERVRVQPNLTISGVLRYYLGGHIDLSPFSRFELVVFTFLGRCQGEVSCTVRTWRWFDVVRE